MNQSPATGTTPKGMKCLGANGSVHVCGGGRQVYAWGRKCHQALVPEELNQRVGVRVSRWGLEVGERKEHTQIPATGTAPKEMQCRRVNVCARVQWHCARVYMCVGVGDRSVGKHPAGPTCVAKSGFTK